MRFFIQLSYNGKAYHGWQNQPDAISVQEVLENALSTILQQKIAVVGAGRTDAGVHASQMFAHFDIAEQLPDNLIFKLNSFLPKDIAIYNIAPVTDKAHARFDALSRTYHYRISTRKNVFNLDHAYRLQNQLDLVAINKACEILLQYKDFQCFSKSHTDVKTYHCKIMQAEWNAIGDELVFIIKADRFLRNMVRAIVGTLINIGLGKMEVEHLREVIESKDRSKAGFSVPAHGLYLESITYPKHIYM